MRVGGKQAPIVSQKIFDFPEFPEFSGIFRTPTYSPGEKNPEFSGILQFFSAIGLGGKLEGRKPMDDMHTNTTKILFAKIDIGINLKQVANIEEDKCCTIYSSKLGNFVSRNIA